MNSPTKQSIGSLGEDIASKFLRSKGYHVLSRNYLKPYGEIDIICTKDEVIHFVEVKTVSRLTSLNISDVSRAEDNVHAKKLHRLSRVIEVYISEHKIESDWQFDVLTVNINSLNKTATVRLLSDIVIGS